MRALHAGRGLLQTATPQELTHTLHAGEPTCGITAIRWEGARLSLASCGAPIPHVLRQGRPLPFEILDKGGQRAATCETVAGDLLVLPHMSILPLDPGSMPEGMTHKLIIDATTPVPPDNRGNYGQPLDSPVGTAEWREKLSKMLAESLS